VVEEDHQAGEEKRGRDRWHPDLHWLTDELAVGACFPASEADRLARDYGIKAVVDLRAEDRDDESALRAAGIELLHLPTPDMESAVPDHLDDGVAFVRDRIRRGDKVLIHCRHGIGRSALLALCVLVDQGLEPLDALKQAKNRREVLSPSRAQYDGWVRWLERRGIGPPDYHSFGCIAYRHLPSS
jgi:hypothetical protein